MNNLVLGLCHARPAVPPLYGGATMVPPRRTPTPCKVLPPLAWIRTPPSSRASDPSAAARLDPYAAVIPRVQPVNRRSPRSVRHRRSARPAREPPLA